jgi:predicted nucleic-acid-binding Zn-ribbon protein
MDFVKSFKKGIEGLPDPEYQVSGTKVKCSHCSSTRFSKRKAQLNTAGLTFLDLDWANKSATVLVCEACGKLEWFLSDPEEI